MNNGRKWTDGIAAARGEGSAAVSDVDILNYALTLEHLEAAYYDEFLDEYSESEVERSEIANYFARPTLQYSTYQQIEGIADHEAAHVETLTRTIEDLGGTPVETAEYEFPYDSLDEFVALSDRIEHVGVSAYAGVAPLIDSDEVLSAALSIHSVEADHATYFQTLNLQRPAPNAFNDPRTMDQVLPIAKQFIVDTGGAGDGLVTATSDRGVSATVERVKRRVQANGLSLVATVDHAANADSVGMDLRPTTLLVFGNPKAGTPLMQARQTVGIDLPQKLLVYENANGRTKLAYNSPAYLAARHGITGQDERLETIDETLTAVAGGDVDRSGADPSELLAGDTGLVAVTGGESVDSTVTRIRNTLESNPAISLVTTVDHAANADSVGMDLRPTTLLIFGNPELGTPLMQARQTVGIDLPQKLLVYETSDGAVEVAYNDPQFIAERHGITGQEDVLSKIEGALRSIATGDSGGDPGGEGELSVAGLSADADGNDNNNLNDEYIIYENTGDAPLDLAGWTVTDSSGTTYTVPDGFSLAPGAQVTLYTGSGTDTDSKLYWGKAEQVWNNGADTMTVRNADGTVVLQRSYP